MRTPEGHYICSGCRVPFPDTLEYFYRQRANHRGRQTVCKRCSNTRRVRSTGDGIYERIARELGITPVRVKQIEASALRKLARNRQLRSLYFG